MSNSEIAGDMANLCLLYLGTAILFFFFFLVLLFYLYQPISLHPRAHMLSHVTPWTAARQAPLSMDFSRQEYWSRLPFPSPGTAILFSTVAASFYTLISNALRVPFYLHSCQYFV